ncbi:MAG: membrane protein insertion efficiency factor YidD [Thermodesulfobacteriota bacterium]|nr:membrane protein insertion efficiency factor YidD [bacterium]MBT3849800.1 membrane protein insertion efficiency factor YidD [bacterium]MBT4634409.1 membrane protein insertion efficiency factor YidD [bacterium]MDG2445686.1 membrane protein insertion efficiency factor YidD [Thermodesulfobacteriota bacterium]RZP14742.1 MAG: membrane protein insertion efficiency factor YidD [Candidatus Dadabacteria bacterium]
MRKLIQKLLLTLIKLYRGSFSLVLPKSCRFTPSCSEYAMQAISTFGPYKGSKLAFLRVIRCNPFCSPGEDLVPGVKK